MALYICLAAAPASATCPLPSSRFSLLLASSSSLSSSSNISVRDMSETFCRLRTSFKPVRKLTTGRISAAVNRSASTDFAASTDVFSCHLLPGFFFKCPTPP
ncbi:hypothetical protein L596_013226 [Steinernema carpocapsae]|uniref:Uncharacterized protein n=1 Tax=Steinernema carpocapsae TaxID=34508 RepID=A0A4U5NZJ8_STECR|nr:hypothetical protein L596_013226 [Steinernema carpocapsae]